MSRGKGLILSADTQLCAAAGTAGNRVGLIWQCEEHVADFLLELISCPCPVGMIDCRLIEPDCIKWVSFVRRLRPKLALIVVHDQQILKVGAKLLELGIFYLCQPPLDETELEEIFAAALRRRNRDSGAGSL